LGEHVLKIEATDKAGNRSERKIDFILKTDYDSAIYSVNKLWKAGEIYKENVKNVLSIGLEKIKNYIDKYGKRKIERTEREEKIMQMCLSKKDELWCRQVFDKKFEHVNYILDRVNKKIVEKEFEVILKLLDNFYKKNWLSQKAYDIIKEDINYLLSNL
jgi:hypothetical protein